MRGRTRAFGLAFLLLTGLIVAAPTPATASSSHTAECQGDWLPATPTSAEIMSGKVSFLGLPAVTIGADVNWNLNPYRNRSWQMVFHSLRWVGRLVADYESTGEQAYLSRAIQIARDWVTDNPRGGRSTSAYAWAEHPIALRAPALVCLSRYVPDAWLKKSLAEHARLLADSRGYQAGHNHGLDQDIGLLRIGCRYRNTSWQRLALRRMTSSMKLDIDAQGALREQAPRYAVYVHDRLQVALDTIADCGLTAPAELVSRWKKLARFISAATQPNGYLVPIGDGPADVPPARYARPNSTVQVFSAGYVFGRTAWDDPRSAYYSIRFGPGLKHHGHEDHLGVTYHAQGRTILTEAGFHSYENTPYRRWTITPEAHNVPVLVGRKFRGRTATKLTHRSIREDRQSFTVSDRAYGKRRTRAILVNHHQDVLAVLDTGGPLRNLWHFDPALKVISSGRGRIVVGDSAWRATLVQLAMPSCTPVGGQKVVQGQTRPYQGWISPGYLKQVPAPAVVSPTAKSLLTIVVPGSADPKVTCSGRSLIVHAPNGPVRIKVSGANLV